MKLAFCCLGETGHLFPMLKFAEEMAERGHKIIFISPNYSKEKVNKLLSEIKGDVTSVVTEEKLDRLQMLPGLPDKDGNTANGFDEWYPFCKKAIQDASPDVCVIDFLTIPSLYAAE